MIGYGTDYPDQVDPGGAALLDELHATLLRYVVFPSVEAADATALYVAATHAQPAWENATRLVIKSPLKQCGKTRLQEIISGTAHRVLRTVNISSAALVRSIDEDDPPTLLLDEQDAVFSTRRGERAEKAEDLRGILNSGHSRGWPYVRWDAPGRRREECPTFAMAVLGGIGDFPDTIEDRAVIIPMRRRAPGEHVQQYRSKRVVPVLHELRNRLHEWVGGQLASLAKADPDLPVEDRPADVWEPLVAIADAAGGDWPDRARKACQVMTGAAEPDEAAHSERLLADLQAVFGDAAALFTVTILDRLRDIEEAPWADWDHSKAFSARDLATLLRPYGIRSRNVREDGSKQAKGYTRDDMAEAFIRYVRPTVPDGASPLAKAGTDSATDDARASVSPADQYEYDL
ncbi:MAG TPA: DUF3631 domain-containing protein [Jiangellaceae bacterium]|nr:DUF3631 domain-containing protein [Jiangellaceae bacterium]